MHKTVKNAQKSAFNSRNICEDTEIIVPLCRKNKEIKLIIN